MAVSALLKISKHVYWFTPDGRTDRPSLAAVVGERGTLLLDVGASPAHTREFLSALASEHLPPPRYAVLTHWHWDHTFGGSALDVPIFGQRITAQELAKQAAYAWDDAALDQRVRDGSEIAFCRDYIKLELPDRKDLRIVTPDVIFDEEFDFDLGDVVCHVRHVGGDHAADSCVMHVDQVLFMGDCINHDIYHNPQRYTEKVFPLLDKLTQFPADTYIIGHGEGKLSPADMQAWIDELRLVGEIVGRVGADKAAVLAAVQTATGHAPNEDMLETVDQFLAGL